ATCYCRTGRCATRESLSGVCEISGRLYALCCR
nr:Chain A, Defensin-5 [Homo sapiens]5CUI_B Chain B, Defensin-5 [Homo sapiens]5CUI_C Chain C, Defensin-5 [Homo sapiens]5CUI_D Chain D, Defensin-5 [Homo sapiens]5CUI_E Chain E, Defensin-5 [Homo sapiens]5CUI_F Chain F, Defensin-5 [Homo sapiens]